MADSTGLDAESGQTLSDFAHTEQSIRRILMTPIGSRVMRRDFGSHLPDLVDAKMTQKTILEVYSAAATAIAKWEPRFRMLFGAVTRATATGQIDVAIYGNYFPLGHKGDYSVVETKSVRVAFRT